MMDDIQATKELATAMREITAASDYSALNPRNVTTLAESIAERALGWDKVADALANGYEFVLTRLIAPETGLEKVKGLSHWDIRKLQGASVTSYVSIVKGKGKRKRELDRELKKTASKKVVADRDLATAFGKVSVALVVFHNKVNRSREVPTDLKKKADKHLQDAIQSLDEAEMILDQYV